MTATLFSLEALQADAGDALLLHYGTKRNPSVMVIDAGPGDVYLERMRPRLETLKAEEIALVIVSHVDDDHILGIIDLFGEVVEGNPPRPVKELWHNAFQAPGPLVERTRSALDAKSEAVVASYPNGRELDRLARLAPAVVRNKGFGEFVLARKEPAVFGDLKLQVVMPDQKRLDALERKWRAALDEGADPATIASFADPSVTNRSSIVVLAECGGRTMLLTGDVRGDELIVGLEQAGLSFTPEAPLDILKVQHHGSNANAKQETFEALPARHYVISANGQHQNPDIETLEMISKARKGDDDFTIHFTNRDMTYDHGDVHKDIGAEVERFLASEAKAGRKYKTAFREKDAPSIIVDLLSDEVERVTPSPPG